MDLLANVSSVFSCHRSSDGGPVVLELDLSRGLLSSAPPNPLAAFRTRQSPSMRQVRDALRTAAQDPEVAGLVLHLGTCPLTVAQTDELAELVRRFAQQRPVIAWTESFGEAGGGLTAYRLACAASEIWVQPSGGLWLSGIELQVTVMGGALDKVSIDPQFGQRKEYKSAAERYAGTEVSAPNREMMQALADSLVADSVERITAARGVSREVVEAVIDDAMCSPQRAREIGLIDQIGYRDEVYASLRERWGQDGRVTLRYAHRYGHTEDRVRQLTSRLKHDEPAIGVVSLSGPIVLGTGRAERPMAQPMAGSDVVCAHLRQAAADDSIKAVVFRIDSPGGSYLASDAIRREVLQLREAGKPVVALMGDVAASGGYFAAMGCQEIVAAPSTLTGSIGVLAGKFVTQRLYERLGLVREALRAGRNAGMFSPVEKFTDEQWRKLDDWLDEVYADFTTKAAADRGMALEELEPLARGRVWTGVDAHQRGLVDHLGGMDTALDRAAALAGAKRDDLVLRAVPAAAWMASLKPAESSESASTQAVSAAVPASPEALVAYAAQALGVAVPAGVLALPWNVRLA